MIVVDPWHWLEHDGTLPVDNPRLRKQALRVAQFIEAAATLPLLTTRETLLACTKRPSGKPCPGLMWVIKTEDDGILAHCPVCGNEEFFIHNWQATTWASGPMEPAPVALLTGSDLN